MHFELPRRPAPRLTSCATTAPPRSSGPRAISSASASCRCSHRSRRARSARGCPARRPRSGEPFARRAARPRRGAAARRHPLAAPALLRATSRPAPRSRRSSPSCSRRRSTRSRSCGGPRRRRPSSRASCSTGWRSCSGSRRAGTATSRTRASTSTLAAIDRCARGDRPRPRRLLRAGALLGREGGADARDAAAEGAESTTQFRMRTDLLGDLSDAAAVVATVGTTATTSVDPVERDRRCVRGGRRVAARRRRLRRHGDGLPRAPVGVRGRRARRLARRQRPQVDAHADGLLAAVDAPAGRLPRGVQPRPRVPAHPGRRGRALAARVRAGARTPVPLAEAVGGAALPRPRRAAGAHSARGRLAAAFESWVAQSRAGSCARRGCSRSCASGSRAPTSATARCSSGSTPAARSSSRTRCWRPLRAAARGRADEHDEADVRLAWEVLRRAAG